MPVSFTTSGKDSTVPPNSVMRLAEVLSKLNPNVLHLHRPGAGHATSYEGTVAAIRIVVARLDTNAGGKPDGQLGGAG